MGPLKRRTNTGLECENCEYESSHTRKSKTFAKAITWSKNLFSHYFSPAHLVRPPKNMAGPEARDFFHSIRVGTKGSGRRPIIYSFEVFNEYLINLLGKCFHEM